jgi:fucose permease
MSKARSATSFQSGASSSGFWGGMTVGRAALPFLATRLGEFRAVIFFICVVVALQLLFWLVPSLIVSAVAVAFLGLFMGPVWGTSMVLVAKIMPRDLHVGSIGFATAFGGSGGAVFPFMVGAIVQKRGVKSLQPVITALLVVIGGLWYWLPRVGSKDHGERNEGEGGREAGENGERNDSAVSH